jgi:hypothetical protein
MNAKQFYLVIFGSDKTATVCRCKDSASVQSHKQCYPNTRGLTCEGKTAQQAQHEIKTWLASAGYTVRFESGVLIG